ncbi:retention module-containing protein [Grimontia marina]|uniref:Poly(Beta-D-mannuronate) C5 epimerase 1 n=1 Tax=Grimontia marina TaxID=646534 RepID=A0A128FGX1_9GAMM|nr:retention module-containing protein [Grimontia marina]CZF85810.1 Poly(beta-D-mannuronate) C5 epimerase 1 [Grimontia marina]
MIGHEFDVGFSVDKVDGQAFLVGDDTRIFSLRAGMQIAANQVVLTNENSSVVVSNEGQRFVFDSRCASCLVPLSDTEFAQHSANHNVTFNGDALNSDIPIDIDIAQLQQLIVEGVDPTEAFEETAAGAGADSANAGFIVIDYGYAATLTEAGFDTAGPLGALNDNRDFLGGDDGGPLPNIDAEGGQSALLSVTEGDLGSSSYGAPDTTSFVIEAGTQALLPGSLQIAPGDLAAFEAELAQITANGEAVVFTRQTSVVGSGTATFTLTGTVDGEVVVELAVVATQSGNSLNINATLTQNGPLDHTTGSGTYVNIDGDRISINLPLQVADTGGDLMQSPAQLTLESNDGAAPARGEATVELTEVAASGADNTASTTDGVDLGSDSIVSVNFDATAAEAQFAGITSHGSPTVVDTSVPGVITLYTDNGGTPEKVLEISLKPSETPGEPAEYSVTQYHPFDQHADSDGDGDDNSTTFTVPFTVTDADGDISGESEVSFKLIDGEVAQGGDRKGLDDKPLDLISIQEQNTPMDASMSNSQSGTVTIDAATDRLDPTTLALAELDDLKSELEELKNNDGDNVDSVTVTTTTDANGNPTHVITASINGVSVLAIEIAAKQGADGLGIELDSKITQYQPLIHPKDSATENTEGKVTADGEQIMIKVPVQVADTDGDLLVDPTDPNKEAPRVINFVVNDDDSAIYTLSTAEAVRVDESGIDDGDSAHQGSKASGTLNIDTKDDGGQDLSLEADKSSGDEITGYGLKSDYVTFSDGSPVRAVFSSPGSGSSENGKPVFLKKDPDSASEPMTYIGVADDGAGNERKVFSIDIYQDGRFEFTLLSAVVHPEGDGQNEITFNLKGFAVDADGDETGLINIPIIVTDDVPRTQGNLSLDLDNDETGALTATVDVFSLTNSTSVPGIDDLSGADASTFITRIYDGTKWVDDISPTTATTVDIFSSTGVKLGTVKIDPGSEPIGNIVFTMDPGLANPRDLEDQVFQYEVRDFDGDTATGQITLGLIDQTPTLTIAPGTSGVITGTEDQGQKDTNTESTGVNGSAGVPINMQLNIGDNDLGETLEEGGRLVLNGEVTLTTRDEAGDIGGTFYFNGVEIVADADGNIVLNSDMFEAASTDEPIIFNLSGVTFVPDPDYSSYDGSDIIQFDVELDVNSHTPVKSATPMEITVQGVADVPTLSLIGEAADGVYEVDEDHQRFGVNDFTLEDLFKGALQDTDGSETLSYEFTLTPDMGELLGGGSALTGSNGSYVLTDPSRLGEVRFVPDADFSGDITLTVKAISTESSPHSVEEASTETSLILRVEPKADDARLTVQRVFGNEDAGNPTPEIAEGGAISLAGKISLTGTDDDGSETLFVRIFDLPAGAVLQLNEGGTITTLTDTSRVSVDDIDKLEIIPPVHSNENFTIKVEGIVVDSATDTGNDERIISATSMDVIITGVADTPEFSVENPGTGAGQWQVDDTTGNVSTTVPEDGVNGDGLVAIDFNVVSGEKAEAPTDTSESLSLIIIDPPEGASFVIKNDDGSLTEMELAFAGWETNDADMSAPRYTVDLAVIKEQDVYVKLPPHSTEDIQINTRLIATENDGDAKSVDRVIEVKIDPPVIDAAATYTNNESSGLEDQWINIVWQPDLTIEDAPDSTALGVVEEVVGATISGFAGTDSVQLVKGSDVITLTPVGGEITLTEAQIADGYQLQVKRAEHSDVDLTLTTEVTVRQDDFEGGSQAEKTVTGVVNVNVIATVETEGVELQLLQGTSPVTEITTDSDGRIDLTDGLNFVHPDDSSNESVIRIVITDLAEGFYVENGIADGEDGWIISDPNNFSIIAPPNSSGQTTFTITAMVQDAGDAGEGDASAMRPISTSVITLNYTNNNTDFESAHQIVAPTSPVVIEGDEDNPISLEALGNAISYPTGTSDDVEFDQITVVINCADVPAGAVISGAQYHIDNDTYVFEVPGRQEGGAPYPSGIDLSGLSITAPTDFAGELNIPLTFVSVDTQSGDTETTDVSVQLNVKPLADVPPPVGAEQPSDSASVLEFTLSVNGTSGLNDQDPPQPLEPGDTEGSYPGQALEDGLISLNLSASLADTDSANGEEKVSAAVLTVPASSGVFVRDDGTETISITLTGAELSDISFKPAEDFSGVVEIAAQLTITDTATTGTDSRDVNTTLSFEVTPVNDEVTFTKDGTQVVEGEVVEIEGTEDQFDGISLADLGASFNDLDGSETLSSLSISNVPEGFTLSSPANNAGGGVWIIAGSNIADLSSLSELKIIAPNDFSGDVDLLMTVYTKEAGASFVVGQSQDLSLTVDPAGDGANVFAAGAASTTEDIAVDLDIEISAKDDRESLPAGPGFIENGPETLLITVTNVPEGAQLVLPDGVTGTVTPETSDGGDVVITVAATELNGLTFVPPQDGNGTYTLDLAIQTVDNGAVSEDVVNKQITVNVSAVNDAPVNILSDSYQAEEDTVLTITDLQVEDVDVRDGNGIVKVELSVGAGSSLTLPDMADTTDITVTGDGTGSLTLRGNIDLINALLASGVEYRFAGENTSGEDSLTMKTFDEATAGEQGSGGKKFDLDTVSIVVAPKSDLPELTAATQLASMRAATGTLVPLLGLMTSLVDPIENEFSLTFSGMDAAAEIVDAAGTPVGTNNGDGTWSFSQTELETLTLSDLNIRFSAQPTGDITVTALSDVGDGDPQQAALTINVNVVDTETTGELNAADNSADNLVVDGAANTQVHGGEGEDIVVGGLGEDILVGGAGNDEMRGGEIGGTGDDVKDTFKWQSGDFGTAAAAATDTIKDFEAGVDVIDISEAFESAGIITFTDLANRLDIQTVDGNTRIQVLDDTAAPIQNIIVEGVTLNTLLGMDATGLTQDEILESMMMAGQLVVFDPATTQFGTEADETLTAGDDGERIYAGAGDDTVTGGLGDDILVGDDGEDILSGGDGADILAGGAGNDTMTGGAGDDTYTWAESDVDVTTLTVDTITDFDVGTETTGDKLDISALLPEAVDGSSSIEQLLDYIRPEAGADGSLTLHISQTAGSMESQDIVLDSVGLSDLGLANGATTTQILTELVQLQTLKLD